MDEIREGEMSQEYTIILKKGKHFFVLDEDYACHGRSWKVNFLFCGVMCRPLFVVFVSPFICSKPSCLIK